MPLTVIVIVLTWVLAGAYRSELHLLIALVLLAIFLFLIINVSLSVASRNPKHRVQDTSRADSPPKDASPEPEKELDSVRRMRFDARVVLFMASVIFSIAVALMAALNGRYQSAYGRLNLDVEGAVVLGGFDADDVAKLPTAMERLDDQDQRRHETDCGPRVDVDAKHG